MGLLRKRPRDEDVYRSSRVLEDQERVPETAQIGRRRARMTQHFHRRHRTDVGSDRRHRQSSSCTDKLCDSPSASSIHYDGANRSSSTASTIDAPISSTAEIEIAQSCLFIPIIVAAWWYWTKRVARTVVKEVITDVACPPQRRRQHCGGETTGSSSSAEESDNGPLHGNNSGLDQFGSWDDVLEQQQETPTYDNASPPPTYAAADVPDRSVRFVRWIRNKKMDSGQRIKAMTQRAMQKRAAVPSSAQARRQRRRPLADRSKNTPMLGSDDDDGPPDGYYYYGGESNNSSMTWECIHDVAGVEIRTLPERGCASSMQRQSIASFSSIIQQSTDSIPSVQQHHQSNGTIELPEVPPAPAAMV